MWSNSSPRMVTVMHRRLPLLLLLALALLALLVAAHQHHRRDGFGDEHEDGVSDSEDERELDISGNGSTEVEVRSKVRSGKSRSELRFRIKTDSGLRLRLEFRRDGESGEVFGKWQVRFGELFDYTESVSPAGYQQGETKSNVLDLASASYSPIQCVGTPEAYNCSVATTNQQLKVQIFSVGLKKTVEGVPIAPTSVKVTAVIAKPNSANRALSVELRSLTKQERKDDSDEHESGFVKSAEGQVSLDSQGFFSWAKTASIDGNSFEVLSSDLITSPLTPASDESSEGNTFLRKLITFSFPSSATGSIVWDPKLGTTAFSAAPSLLCPSLLMLLTLLFFTRLL